MFGKYFDTSAIDAFAQDVVPELRKAVRLEGEAHGRPARRQKDPDERLLRMATQLVHQHRLNLDQKAKLGPYVQEATGKPPAMRASSARPSRFGLVKLVAMTR